MRLICSASVAACLLLVCVPSPLRAQSSQASVPRVINFTGVFQPADGQPPRAVETVTLALYDEPAGGTPLWEETQSVAVDANGRYALHLGAVSVDGIPAAVLAAGAQWLGITFDRPGEVEGPRLQLTSVPYTLRAADADTLGGLPASAYLRAPTATGNGAAATTTSQAGLDALDPGTVAPQTVQPGTPNFLAKYVTGTDVGNSGIFENASGQVGIGTQSPLDSLHVKFTNTGGTATGYSVQNLGSTSASYSGMLFYDQNGDLAQFQGFSNGTHEYRINNIARVSPGGAFNGSINFMVGSSSKFKVSPAGISIGTTSPLAGNLDVSNATFGTDSTNVNVITYSANGFGPAVTGRKARGTQGVPTAALNNDALLLLSGNGYGATTFSTNNSAQIAMRASENWTDAAQGSYMSFFTTPNGTTISNPRMTINQNGNVGIGVFSGQANLEVSNANGASGAGVIFATTFANAGTTMVVGRRARGTGGAPTAVQNGDSLAAFIGTGYGATGFAPFFFGSGMNVSASENWTDTAQGSRLNFNTTATGTNTPTTRMTIASNGNVGIGTITTPEALNILRDGSVAGVQATSFSNEGCCAGFNGRVGRGTIAAQAAVQLGDPLALFTGDGHTGSGFSSEAGGMMVIAAENWSNDANGTLVAFTTTPLGSNDDGQARMAIMPDGNVGIGTFTEIPTIADKLQVFGDIRVGTTGTDGCLKSFDGTALAGTCSSDRRFKKDIVPFAPALGRLTALQPVHYRWRAVEFPERHFGDAQTYGLIAQDVEQVLPELVATGDDGYKAVDYSKLPLLTIQALKELNAEVRGLRTENDELKQRLAELERRFTDLLAAPRR